MNRRAMLATTTTAVATTLLGSTAATATPAPVTPTPPPPARPVPAGRVVEGLRLPSRLLRQDVRYSLYLPPGHRPGRRYPVLYLLHGLIGDDTEWPGLGLGSIADRAIASGALPPTVVVMPDARRDPGRPPTEQAQTYYMDDADGSFRYAEMVVRELLPGVEARHGAGGSAARRAIGGESMGGFGALSFAFRHPGLFSAAFGLSVAHRTDAQVVALPQTEFDWRYAKAWGAGLVGQARLNERYRQWNLLDTIARTPAEELSRTAYFLDCGSYDGFFEGNADLHLALTAKAVPHRFMAREGAHEWDYWTSGLPVALEAVGTAFTQATGGR
ncbi:alpha/beta hydrolase-fold protein [Actinokineospora sp. PR83]|uniref:alpha/beta hydrolase n=1 Tax=Actinokineospora sp. PR83 TaxID=2884908 RepID=UPI001EEC5DF9|nr:alpha/beta hydrolase-fold protein [Actinokineospora sp. PR83]MCG8914536.1 alpha/beta hydrolase-fold protein [Actinokineospora sp. PR83]